MGRLLLDPRNWPAALGCGLFWALVRALPVAWLQALGATLGRLAVVGQRRAVARINLDHCFADLGPGQRRALLEGHRAAVGQGLVETGLAYWADGARLRARARVSGLEHLSAARAQGRGVLVLMAHYTMVELACRLANEFADRPIRLLGRRHNQPLIDAVIDAARQRHAGPTIEKKDLKSLWRALKAGEAVFYAPDQNFTYASVFAPFFGVPAATVTATADIVQRTGAQVVPLWCRRDEQGLYHLRFEPAWTDFPEGDPLADATRVNAWIESRVRETSSQYLWVHRRFKTRPPGADPLYPPSVRRRKDRVDQ